MTNPDDLIRRQDAISAIRAEMKRTYTAARRQGFKQSVELIESLPVAGDMAVTLAEPTALSPGLGRSFWFSAGGFRLCDNCGGRGDPGRPTKFCPHCGFRMDALEDEEIE